MDFGFHKLALSTTDTWEKPYFSSRCSSSLLLQLFTSLSKVSSSSQNPVPKWMPCINWLFNLRMTRFWKETTANWLWRSSKPSIIRLLFQNRTFWGKIVRECRDENCPINFKKLVTISGLIVFSLLTFQNCVPNHRSLMYDPLAHFTRFTRFLWLLVFVRFSRIHLLQHQAHRILVPMRWLPPTILFVYDVHFRHSFHGVLHM